MSGQDKHIIFENAVKNAKTSLEVEQLVKSDKNYKKYSIDCNNFIEYQKQKDILPLYVEEELYDEELNIIGIVDRVECTKDGLLLIDYKTGKSSTNIAKYRFELALYAYLFEKLHNQRIAQWGIYFSTSGQLLKEGRSQAEIDKAVEKVRQVRRDIKTCEGSNDWPKKYTPLCNYCELFMSGDCKGEDGWLFGEED